MGQPVVHFEVIGKDPDKLRSYFGELFGWKFVGADGADRYYDRHRRQPGEDGIGGGVGGCARGLRRAT